MMGFEWKPSIETVLRCISTFNLPDHSQLVDTNRSQKTSSTRSFYHTINQSSCNPTNPVTIAAHNVPWNIEQEEWQLQGSKMNPDSMWVEWSRKDERCQTSIKMTTNLGKKVKRDQGGGTIRESCNFQSRSSRQADKNRKWNTGHWGKGQRHSL